MKLRSELLTATMQGGEELRLLLKRTLDTERITHVLESGTYLGLGSTTWIAESFAASRSPDVFVTIEINWQNWRQARLNLRRFSFVRPLWGRTVTAKAALHFLENDNLLRNPDQYPEIFIDRGDPLRLYREEVLGGNERVLDGPRILLRFVFDRFFSYAGEGLLEKYLVRFQMTNPLIILDSAGGIGFLEFSIVRSVMRRRPYLLLLDDINHLKHFRSYEQIKKDPKFSILGLDESRGWLLARHLP
jgi:hypothetical protein